MPGEGSVFRELRTERLTLRPFRLSDVDDVLRYSSDPEWAFFARPDDPTREQIEHELARWAARDPLHELVLAVVLDNRVVGNVDLTFEDDSADLGYGIARDLWGRGFATEAARAVRDFGFTSTPLQRMTARHDPRNPASGRVLEKLGFVFERQVEGYGVRRGETVARRFYTLPREAWSRLVRP